MTDSFLWISKTTDELKAEIEVLQAQLQDESEAHAAFAAETYTLLQAERERADELARKLDVELLRRDTERPIWEKQLHDTSVERDALREQLVGAPLRYEDGQPANELAEDEDAAELRRQEREVGYRARIAAFEGALGLAVALLHETGRRVIAEQYGDLLSPTPADAAGGEA